jgi:hypothetical protein
MQAAVKMPESQKLLGQQSQQMGAGILAGGPHAVLRAIELPRTAANATTAVAVPLESKEGVMKTARKKNGDIASMQARFDVILS